MPYPKLQSSPRPPDIPAEANTRPPDLDAMGKPIAHIGPAPDSIDTALSYLPVAGAVAGGALGEGVLSIPLAGLLAAGGRGIESTVKSLRHGVGNVPETKSAMSGANDLLDTGIQQGALTAAGEGVGRVLEPVARPIGNFLMDQAVRPSKALMQEFPNLINTIMDEGLRVGKMIPGMQKGSELAAGARAASGRVTTSLLNAAGRAGYKIDPTQLLGGVTRLREKLSAKPISEPYLKQIDTLTGQYLKEHTTPVMGQVPAPNLLGTQMAGGSPTRQIMGQTGTVPALMTPIEAKSMKQIAQAESAPLFKAQRKGAVIPTADRLEARVEQEIGKSTKGALESIPRYGERIGQSEARTQNLIGAERAIKDAELARVNTTPWEPRNAIALMMGGSAGYASGDPATALETILMSRALMNPTVLSHLVQAAKSRLAKTAVRQLPRAGYALSNSQVLQQDQP